MPAGLMRGARVVLVAALGVGALVVPVTAQAPASPQAAAGKALDARPFGVPVVEVAGGAEAIGREYGQRLHEPMRELFDKYLLKWLSTDARRWVALAAARSFTQYVEPHHKAEIEALAETTGFEPAEVMLAQCFLDLSPMTACSSISLPGEAFADGVPRLARNLDFPSLGVADKHSVLVICRPEGKHAFASVSWPGMIGVLSGMNEHGLVLVNMEVDRSGGLPRAMPYTLLYRKILEECRDVGEAVALLEKTPRQTPNNVMLMDAAGRRAVVEITPAKITVRPGQAGRPLISTNHHRGTDQATPGYCPRYDRLLRSSADIGDLRLADLQGMLKDVQQGSMTLQAMVFEPSTRTLYLATGARAAERELKRVDLGPYFKRN